MQGKGSSGCQRKNSIHVGSEKRKKALGKMQDPNPTSGIDRKENFKDVRRGIFGGRFLKHVRKSLKMGICPRGGSAQKRKKIFETASPKDLYRTGNRPRP